MLLKVAFTLASPTGRRGKLTILIFHRVLAERDPLFPEEADIRRFDEVMHWVKTGFNVLPLDEAVDRLKRGLLPARAAAITFDDGYADNLIHATPILQKHGLPATFFIATGFLDGGRMWNDTIIESVRAATESEMDGGFLGLGRLSLQTINDKRAALDQLIPAIKHLPGAQRAEVVTRIAESCQAMLPNDLMLTSNQLRVLRNTGMSIGAHTVNHPILAKMDDSAAKREIADSRDFLEGLLGERIHLFAYPNGRLSGDYTRIHAEIVKSLGFDAAVTTNWGACSAASDPYQLPRFTPWDRSAWRYGLRLLINLRQSDVALSTQTAPLAGDQRRRI